MEKKTFGQFLALLRRSQGLTQKELGEKLFVSDKTVSRWERDECTPDLDLIPAIAEIFGITTDELLRRERRDNNACSPFAIAAEQGKDTRGDKQFRVMLHNHKKRFDNLSLISVGLAIGGLITAIICNIGFSRGLLGFCLASVFFVAAAICQICFSVSSVILIDEENDARAQILKTTNTKQIFATVKILIGIWVLWAFCLPIAILTLGYYGSYYGLQINSWLLFGSLFAIVAFLIAFCVYRLHVINFLIKKEIVWCSEEEREILKTNQALLKKIRKVFLLVSLCLLAGLIAVSVIDENGGFIKSERFNTADEFIERVQKDYDEWFEEAYPDPEYSNSTFPQRSWGELEGKKFYYNEDLYYIFRPEDYKFITNDSHANAQSTVDALNFALVILEIVNLSGCISRYFIKHVKKQEQ